MSSHRGRVRHGRRADRPVESLEDAWRRYIRNKGAVVAGAVFILRAALLPARADPLAVRSQRGQLRRRESQTRACEHPFGTDKFGRDLFTRTALGGRVSILIAFGATFAILAIGVVYGSISGFVGGRLDNGMMRFLDALYGLPYLPFAIITLAIIGHTNKWSMMIALSIASWFTTARIVRGQVMTLKENDYVRAAKAVGARWYRILGRHLLPNTLGILIIAIFLELPAVILGRGVPLLHRPRHQPARRLVGLDGAGGRETSTGRTRSRSSIPSVAIATLVICANFIADGLRDALDPRTRET